MPPTGFRLNVAFFLRMEVIKLYSACCSRIFTSTMRMPLGNHGTFLPRVEAADVEPWSSRARKGSVRLWLACGVFHASASHGQCFFRAVADSPPSGWLSQCIALAGWPWFHRSFRLVTTPVWILTMGEIGHAWSREPVFSGIFSAWRFGGVFDPTRGGFPAWVVVLSFRSLWVHQSLPPSLRPGKKIARAILVCFSDPDG